MKPTTTCCAALCAASLTTLMVSAGTSPVIAGEPEAMPLTSAAIDATIFRPGEVKRFTARFGGWTVVCDEVTRLKQRFCSLRTKVVEADGVPVGNLTISTGQDGRPAALLELLRARSESGIEVSAAIGVPVLAARSAKATPLKTKTAQVTFTRLRPVGCPSPICTFVWTLKSEQIAALNEGGGLKLLASAPAGAASVYDFAPPKPVSIAIVIAAEGFKDAVAVSLRAFE